MAFRRVVAEWHRRALPNISTKEFDVTWAEFIDSWPNVKFAEGEGGMQKALELARTHPSPVADLLGYGNPKMDLLISICEQLQALHGDGDFFLASRKAGDAIGVSHTAAAVFLTNLVSLKVLDRTKKGERKPGGRAACYRFIGNDTYAKELAVE